MPTETHQAIETVFRIERARLIAGLTRIVRDVGRAEELAQDALVTALAEWPRTGVPTNPGAWLMATARRRAIDGFRHDRMRARKHAEIGRGLEEADDGTAGIEAALDDDVGDDLLEPRLRRLPSGPAGAGARGADAAADRRPHHRRDRPRLPRQRGDRRPAHRSRQEDAARRRPRLRGAARRRAAAAARLGARGALPDLQRGLRRHGGRGPDPPGPLRRGPPPRAHPRPADARRARGLRPRRADGAAGLAARRAHGEGRRARCRCPSRTAPAGTGC